MALDTYEEDDISAGRLGDDFDGVQCLSTAEVCIVLDALRKDHEDKGKELTSVFTKTHMYVQRFSGTRDPTSNKAAVQELREALEAVSFAARDEDGGDGAERKLEQFEIAALTSLNPEDVDEAVTLIPTLERKLDVAEIESVIEILARSSARMFS